ncbi:hypothetical protein WA026_013594 [Henosepilachna vigintioctopunctata]|uniref:LAGLIDADG homing endonuclease n=1 Tax=Henosepilachna vigintioctopunctata TaxID=420089 RepID=A0AAW1VCQ9_9CUCU
MKGAGQGHKNKLKGVNIFNKKAMIGTEREAGDANAFKSIKPLNYEKKLWPFISPVNQSFESFMLGVPTDKRRGVYKWLLAHGSVFFEVPFRKGRTFFRAKAEKSTEYLESSFSAGKRNSMLNKLLQDKTYTY